MSDVFRRVITGPSVSTTAESHSEVSFPKYCFDRSTTSLRYEPSNLCKKIELQTTAHKTSQEYK